MNEVAEKAFGILFWIGSLLLAFNNARYDNDCYQKIDYWMFFSLLFFGSCIFCILMVIQSSPLSRRNEILLAWIAIISSMAFLPAVPFVLLGTGACTSKPPVFTYWIRWILVGLFSSLSISAVLLTFMVCFILRQSQTLNQKQTTFLRDVCAESDSQELKGKFDYLTRCLSESPEFYRFAMKLMFFKAEAIKNACGVCKICEATFTGMGLDFCCGGVCHVGCYKKLLMTEKCDNCQNPLISFLNRRMQPI